MPRMIKSFIAGSILTVIAGSIFTVLLLLISCIYAWLVGVFPELETVRELILLFLLIYLLGEAFYLLKENS